MYAIRSYYEEMLAGKLPSNYKELTWMEGRGHLEVNSGLRLVSLLSDGELQRRDIHLQVSCEQGLWSRHSVWPLRSKIAVEQSRRSLMFVE